MFDAFIAVRRPALATRVWAAPALLLTIVSASWAEPLPITTQPVAAVAVNPQHNAPAKVLSLNDAVISAEISGVIREIPVRVGDAVASGDLLVAMSCDDYEIEQEQAQAALEQAESKLRLFQSQMASARALSKAKSISQERLDERKANQAAGAAEVERLAAALRKSDLQISRCQVKAPFDGVVIERLASIGELATPGTRLVRLLDSDNIEVQANIQEVDLDSIRQGTEVTFITPHASFPLRLRKILPIVDTEIRSVEARFEFVDRQAPPGAVGRLHWSDSSTHLPPNLLVTRNGKIGVFLNEDGMARFVEIDGAREGRFAKTDLDTNLSLILEGRHSLQDGDPVRLVD
jgi:RND family efflux transporter MFP subunit